VDPASSVILLVADGARVDTLRAALAGGALPALARLADEGGYHTITTVFPSVTGPAYVPFLMGHFPGAAGMPGLRWYDRSREHCGAPAHARSYVGWEMGQVDRDLTPAMPTLFELAPSSLGALSVITRGLPKAQRVEGGVRFAARAAWTHLRGDVRGWLAIDRDVGDQIVRRVREERPALTFAAFTGVDKTSHAAGHGAPIVLDALRIVDDVVARLRADAEARGTWERTHLWIVSDHGHSPVTQHDDLADVMRGLGLRVLAHPRVLTRAPQVAVMVSGNAMAHIYLGLSSRTPLGWDALKNHMTGAMTNDGIAKTLLARPSVDLMILPNGANDTSARGACEIHTRDRGSAVLMWRGDSFTYDPMHGDPLGLGTLRDVSADEMYRLSLDTDYPDAPVQLAALCSAPRTGDIIVSAARGWDYRARYEPIPHASSHGALHREHMLVPFLTNHPVQHTPRRTIDVMPSAAALLGCRAHGAVGDVFTDSPIVRGTP